MSIGPRSASVKGVTATTGPAGRPAPIGRGRSLNDQVVDAVRAAIRDRELDEAGFMDHDRQLHDHFLQAGGNLQLATTVERLREVTRMLGASTVDRSRGLPEILAEHVPIVEAVEKGDAERAADHMRRHVEHTGRLLVAQAAAESAEPVDPDDLWRDVVG